MITTKYMRSLVLLCMSVAFGMAYADSYYRDVTAKYMKNPDFMPGWQGGLSNVQDSVGECFDGAFNLYQVLYDMPPGTYELTANAFYRCGTNDFSKENMTDGRNHYAYLYLGETRVPVTGLFDNGLTEAPNNTFAANQAFKAGEFLNTVTHYHPGGDLVLGIRNLGGYSEEWCAFSNFKLKRGSEDYTTLIVNADFAEGIDIDSEAWNFLNSDYSIKRPDFNHGGGVFRKTNASPYNFGQQVELPAGTYRFSALTFMRYGGAGNYDSQIITCKGQWEVIDSNPYPSPKQWYDQNLYSDTDYTANAYLYVSFENDKPTSLETAVELLEENVKLTRVKGPWEICSGDYPLMPENETRGTAEGTQIIPSYDTRNVVAGWVDSGSERESAAAFINEPDKWRQYVEFTLTEPSKVWVGLGKDQNSPRQYWNPCTDFKLEQLTEGNPASNVIARMYPGPEQLIGWGNSSSMEVVTEDGQEALKFTNTYANGNPWEVQMAFDYNYLPGTTYYFTFDVKGTPRNAITSFFQSTDNYITCGNLTTFGVTPEWTTVSIKGIPQVTDDRTPNRWVMDLGDYEGTMYISNMVIYTQSEVQELVEGDKFEYEGIWYTVMDAEAMTCETTPGSGETPSNSYVGDLVIPSVAMYGNYQYTVTGIGGHGFQTCESITSLKLPETVVQIGNRAFEHCSGLAKVTFPSSLTHIGNDAFRYCSSLDTIVIPERITVLNPGVFSDCTSLADITLPASLTTISGGALQSCSSLRSIFLPEALTEIGAYAFAASPLESIYYPASQPIACEENIFSNEVYETGILYMQKALLADVQAVTPWKLFKHIVAKDGVVPPDVAAGDEFEYEGIKYTVLDPIALTCETKAGYEDTPPGQGTTMYGGNRVFNELTIPETVSDGSLNYTVTAIGDYGFCGSAMPSVTLPSTIAEIGQYAFFGCDLTHMEWPESVPYLAKGVFSGCHELESVVLPETIDSIGQSAFSWCLALTSITIPANVTKVGNYAFNYCPSLKEVTIEGSQTILGYNAFWNCGSLIWVTLANQFDIEQHPFERCSAIASVEWKGDERIPMELISYFANPNLLVYAQGYDRLPTNLYANTVILNEEGADWECSSLRLTQGYPFYPKYTFTVWGTAEMTVDFNQTTPIGGCAGWQTIVLPFDVSLILNKNNDDLTPFGAVEDLNYQRPFWLYRADSLNGWREATRIQRGIPYIISMPNNEAYDPKYNISGPVTFVSGEGFTIEPNVTNTYSVQWRNGTQFRSLWLPLDEVEAEKAMGLNVGIDDLRNDDGELLLPGSAFHRDVMPRPLEAYVRSDGSRMAMPVIGGQSHVALMKADNGLSIHAENGSIFLKSDCDRTVEIYRIDGVRAATVRLTSGEPAQVDGLAKGLYIIGGHKVIMK